MWHFSCGFTTRGMMKSTWWKDAFWKCIVSLNSIKTWSRAYIVFAWHGLVINSLFSFLLVDNDNFKMLWSRWKLQSHVFLYNLSCRRNKKFSKSTRTVAYKSVFFLFFFNLTSSPGSLSPSLLTNMSLIKRIAWFRWNGLTFLNWYCWIKEDPQHHAN